MTIYFYKVWQPYGCFSNFSRHSIQIQGTYWSTVEHYYQAQKFVGSVDAVIIPAIQAAKTPEEAAALGRCCTRQLRPDWEVVKTKIMREAVLKKFLTHVEIRDILLATGDEMLVENSPTDYFWGCGADKTGQNHLGKILMAVRAEIRQSRLFSVISGEFKCD
ncbi:NADAR family protein [Nostocales cyanobacterium LEGE 11386]|nr:NADAR family protein [Nostocales cyanobacterium LEGE 11386]